MMQRPASTNNLSSFVADDTSTANQFQYSNTTDTRNREDRSRQEDASPPKMRGMFGESYPSRWSEPKLFIVGNGQGSPCLNLNRVSRDVADATVGTDLVIIEGMGRAIHTNFNVKLKCDVLKLAMIKNKHLAMRLFNGDVYDCVCRFDGC